MLSNAVDSIVKSFPSGWLTEREITFIGPFNTLMVAETDDI